jgi:hypothetical protein
VLHQASTCTTRFALYMAHQRDFATGLYWSLRTACVERLHGTFLTRQTACGFEVAVRCHVNHSPTALNSRPFGPGSAPCQPPILLAPILRFSR